MRVRNKTLFLLIMGFVFLFSANALRLGSTPKITAKDVFNVKQPQTKLVLAATSSKKDFDEEERKTEKSNEQMSVEKKSEIYFKVVKVIDGDTIDVDINGKTERIRLIGVNTPEIVDPRKAVECFGREASDNAHELLDGAEVKIAADKTQDDRDKYGRLLRYVWRSDGLFYNLEAIKSGFAYEYTYHVPYLYQNDFKAAQKNAEDNKLGLWADGVCEQKQIKTFKENVSDGRCLIKGNVGTKGDKIYHLLSCQYYKQTVIEENKGEKWFCSEDEAMAAGWRKAENCP